MPDASNHADQHRADEGKSGTGLDHGEQMAECHLFPRTVDLAINLSKLSGYRKMEVVLRRRASLLQCMTGFAVITLGSGRYGNAATHA
ncbi:hypothetical protein EZH22_03675 [Xanthobacter dioxanivorans]|uniref:Uncharacterized protein n=1 Tax=Xanthobacter dioxanivorans TaxID=2528964 RepID=A0A974PPS6_9HYPH|nr:hypothetical protein [Xanthobacter dioxanivorans]QRG07512.1 hypothetical protein EZH22_03675 [Xanthobacter dioxanivorans]